MPTKPPSERISLAEFDDPDHAEPWITTIPEWPEILEGWKRGKSEATIRKWLVTACGYSPDQVTYGRVHYLGRNLASVRGTGG